MNANEFRPLEQQPSTSERIAERVRDLVRSGTLAAGDKLPSENALAKSFQVSRPVVREALRGLAMLGIVESKQGGGCFVTDLEIDRLMAPLSFVLSLREYPLESLFGARSVIDAGVAADAARNASEAQRERLGQLVDIGFRLVDDPVGFRVMDAEFHTLVSESADNAFLDRVSRSLYGLAMETRRRVSAQPGVLKRSVEDHAAIARAIEARDADAAAAAMSAHVEHIRHTTMAFVASEGEGRDALSGTGG